MIYYYFCDIVCRSNTYGVGADDANFGITFEPFPLAGVHVISAVRFQSPAHQVYMIISAKLLNVYIV